MTADHPDPAGSGRDFSLQYLGTLATEKQTSIGELQNATTWGLTAATTGIVFIVGRSGFPDQPSLLGIASLLIFVAHFMVRAMKGYINVMRWSLLQRILINEIQSGEVSPSPETSSAIREYHTGWKLPVKRTTVIWKGVFELAFGYLLIALLGIMAYTLDETHWTWLTLPTVSISLLASASEFYLFLRSPYMRVVQPHDDAQRMR
ncbi:hypothetical protein [Streptomyces sp. NPDC086777]|uniref:hypothetical protein n=1 Tax=Streptomyces sp. NPDC086777 TaxID=3154866 RepID=UPI00344E943A